MSKKKVLSPTASLATCLDFAARVLSSTASVQEICTKPVLAPMVVEAHRYGQQATKHLEPGTPADVRKLLKVLQGSKLSGGSPVAELEVADLTWDFEGAVADTLEMEMEELKDRAAMNTVDTCVVFSASTPVSNGGQAVIWFPLESYDNPRDEDDRRNIVKKQQILVYVCPGRVKVVKSVGDLVKKLYDELPSLREKSAVYKVWAVLKRTPRTDNQQEHKASPMQEVELEDIKASQITVERLDGSLNRLADPIVSVPSNLGPIGPNDPVRVSTESRKSKSDEGDQNLRGSLAGSMNSRSGGDSVSRGTFETDSQPQQDVNFDQEEFSPLPPRLTVFKDVTSLQQRPDGSIFSFGVDKKISTELPLTSSQHLLQDLGVNERDADNDEILERDEGDAKSVESGTGRTGDNHAQASWKKKNVVSSSVPVFSPESCCDHDVGLGGGVRLPQGIAWQSLDGKVLRRSVRPTGEGLEESGNASGVNKQEDDAGGSAPGAAEAITSADEEPRPAEMKTPQVESSEQFPEPAVLEQVDSLDGDGPTIFKFGSDLNQGNECQVSDGRLSTGASASEMPTDIQSAGHVGASATKQDNRLNRSWGDDASPVEPSDKVELARPIHSELSVSPPKPKPAPVNYKDKLGARIWWELEYTARKLEREEMMERRQQAHRSEGSKRASTTSEASRPKLGHRTGPQRLEPTGWSKQPRPQRQNEVSVSTDEPVDGGSNEPTSSVGAGFAPELMQEVVDVVDAASSMTESKAMVSPTIFPRSNQGNDNQKIDNPPSEALPSAFPVQTNLRGSKNQSPLSEETEALPQLTTPRQSVEISTRKEHQEGTHNPPVQEDSESPNGICEPSTLSPPEALFDPLMQKFFRSSKDVTPFNTETAVIKQLDSSKSEISMSTKYHEVYQNPPRELARNDVQSPALQASLPHVRDSSSKVEWNEDAPSEMEGSRQSLKRFSTSKKSVVDSVHSSVARSDFPVEMKAHGSCNHDEDEAAAQIMWGSTRTSYEDDRTTYSHQSGEGEALQVPALPFTVRGRVPIRTHRDPGRVTVPAEPEASKDSSPSTSSVSESSLPRNRTTLPKEEHNLPSRIKPSSLPQQAASIQTTPRIPTPPPVATFIPLVEDATRSPAVSREERLNDLRQKKLRKLQQTRDLSLQQHKEKQNQRHIQKPLSFASSVYSKKASNRQLMQNALEFTLLAGGSMEKERTLALQALAESTCDNFIVLLKSAKELKFRALYENHVERDLATRIYSVLPSNSSRAPLKISSSEMIAQFFKYSSAKKQFLPVPTRSFTVKTDACALVDQLVFKGKSKSTALARLL